VWLSNTAVGMVFMVHQAVVFTAPLMVFDTKSLLRIPGGSTASGEASPATEFGKLEIVCVSPVCVALAAPAWATAAACPASPVGLAVDAGGVIGINVPALAEDAA